VYSTFGWPYKDTILRLFLRHTFSNQNNVKTWEIGNIVFKDVLPPFAFNAAPNLIRTDSCNFGIFRTCQLLQRCRRKKIGF